MAEKIVLKVENIQPVIKKDGSKVEGMGQNGVHWQLFKFNQKYSYFHHGEGLPDYTLGVEYPFDLETKQDGQYTNYQITRPKEQNPTTSTTDLPLEFIQKGFGLLRGENLKLLRKIENLGRKIDILLEGTGVKPNLDIDTSNPDQSKSEWLRK